MENIISIGKACVGCGACAQICPQKCIRLKSNAEGFLYPVVDDAKCSNCGACLKHCPQGVPRIVQHHPIATYGIKNQNNQELYESASGGAADIAAKSIIERGGIVFGAAYAEDWSVHHIAIWEDEERKRLRSSKYVQSDVGDCYLKAKKELENGRLVLFTGTPCQIDGLLFFLGRTYDNLFTLDLICHGVPSPLLFKKYIEWQKEKMGGKIIYYNFRSKDKRGWGTQYLIKTKTKTKTKTNELCLDRYGKHFMDGDCYRDCCYDCRYSNIDRPADMTVGDFWGIQNSHPKFYSSGGVSSAMISTDNGKTLFEWMKKYSEYIECSMQDVLEKQGNLMTPTIRPAPRAKFYAEINQKNDYINTMRVGLQLKKRLKSVLPKKILLWLKTKI